MAYPNVALVCGREIERFVRFAVIGMTGTLVDFGVLIVLKEAAGLPLLAANSLSYTVGIVNNFVLNRTWTFADAPHKALWRQFGQFALVSLIGLLLNNLIVAGLGPALGSQFGLTTTGYLLAKVIATALVLVWNFSANRLWTFREAR